jgi:hypothetical protein
MGNRIRNLTACDMKSGGQMSSQSPVVWWYREVVWMCVEAVPVLGAESADFLFNWCDLRILSEDHILHVQSVIMRRTLVGICWLRAQPSTRHRFTRTLEHRFNMCRIVSYDFIRCYQSFRAASCLWTTRILLSPDGHTGLCGLFCSRHTVCMYE